MSDPSSTTTSSMVPEGSDRPSRPLPNDLIEQAQASLQQTLKRHAPKLAAGSHSPSVYPSRANLEQVTKNLSKLEKGILRVAVFGLVSRGKSSVINALVQQDVFQTGPLHGVTKWPRSVYWTPPNNPSQLQIELIDTPGLDEVEGAVRAEMAQEIAQEADLILLVLAGEVTPVEQDALRYLQAQQKPLMVVGNKCDRYPDFDPIAALETLGFLSPTPVTPASPTVEGERSPKAFALTPANVIAVAAAPDPVQVRVEWPDGRTSYEWEKPPARVDPLVQRLHQILVEDGWWLIVQNALRDSQTAEVTMAATAIASHRQSADSLVWQFAQWKSVLVAANPVVVADVIGGVALDLILIRSLARLYGLPMTGHEAGKLWRAIAWSTVGLTLGEAGTHLLWGLGKSAAMLTGPLGGVVAYSTAAIAQGSLAGYGAYRVGKAAQVYLQQGCTWGEGGVSTILKAIQDKMNQDRVLAELSVDLRNPNS
ncbi:MAG: GTP-binding protein [Leptolyngbyaceae cyanobacterium]